MGLRPILTTDIIVLLLELKCIRRICFYFTIWIFKNELTGYCEWVEVLLSGNGTDIDKFQRVSATFSINIAQKLLYS